MSDEALEALANMIPLGFTERDPYRNVFEAADAILASDWLAEERAKAWAEGYADGFGDGGVNAYDPVNPYRGEGDTRG